jgi:hypothetical protein
MLWLYLYHFGCLPLDRLAKAFCKLGDYSSFAVPHQNNDHILCTNQQTLHSLDFAEALLSIHLYLPCANSINIDIIVKRIFELCRGINQKTSTVELTGRITELEKGN